MLEILFAKDKLSKDCNDLKRATIRWGAECGRLVMRRLDDLRAAPNLEVMRKLPQARCRELRADRKGQIAVDVKQPKRLIFEPANDPPPYRADGGWDWQRITIIRILEVTDYHG